MNIFNQINKEIMSLEIQASIESIKEIKPTWSDDLTGGLRSTGRIDPTELHKRIK